MTRSHTDKEQLSSMFAFLHTYLKYSGKLNMLDENKVMEDIMCEVLNRVYGWHLVNLNTKEKNYPGIDLGDIQQGLGIQVTADKTSAKIQYTFSKVIAHEVHETYPHIKMMILGEKQSSYTIPELGQYGGKIVFDAKQDVLDFTDLLEACSCMEANARHELVEYLQAELDWNAERTIARVDTYEKLQRYLEEQKKENSYITVLGVQRKLPIEKAWMRLNIINEKDLREKQAQTQWEFLKKYDEYSGRMSSDTYDVETLLLETGNKVVLGGPGMGKSTMCKKLFCQADAMQIAAGKVRLWDVARYMRDDLSFEEALRKTMTQSMDFEFDKADIARFFSLLILDGLDECGDYRREVAKEIALWGFGHPEQKIVVTSRPIGYDATELSEFKHYQILPIDDWQLDSFARQLMEMIQSDYQTNYQWFSDRIKNRDIYRLACRSPLILGFMVQLSLKQKEFGTNKICLYQAILDEWLHGSSRENKMLLWETDLSYGIEAIAYYMMSKADDAAGDAYTKNKMIAYAGDFLAKEMECPLAKARKAAEKCLEFWLQRGILDKGIHKEQECFLFLHLNVGEYLAACFLAKRSKDERRKWISDHYRDNIWQETLRMAIACETDDVMVQELIAIEQRNELPEGTVFLAAEGIGERKDKRVPQELYDQLWKYAFGNNTYLCEKAARAINHLRGGKIDWHVQQLEEYVQSKNLERQMVAYHILLIAFSDDKERMQGLARKYVLYVIRLLHQGEAEDTFDDLANAIQALIPNVEDHELTDAIKSLPLEEMSMNEWKVIENYANAIGEGEWINAEEQALAEEGPKFSLDTFNMQMRQSEQKLIEILIELFGMTSCDKIASCYEYSKISAVMGLWSSPLPEMRLMGKDLERPHSKKLVKAICETVELNETQLKKELYSLLHYVNENRCFVSSDHILNLHLDGEWEKCKGKVALEVIEEGLHSRSDIMGECAVYMAAYNIETAGVRDLLISMLRTSSIETVVEHAGRVLAACEEKNLAMYAEARLMDDAIPSYICLYDYLPKRVEDSAAENWLRIIRRGFMGNRYMVSATLNYILSVEPDNIPQRIKDTLISMVEKSFVEWNQKQVKCLHCKEEIIVKEDGLVLEYK